MQLFSDSFLNDYKILNKAIVGIEFEFFSKLSYLNTLEHLNRKLDRKVKGIKQYHPDTKPTDELWILTPDWSAINMSELITHPMPYAEAIIVIPQVLNILEEIGYTNDRTGIHLNISFTDKDINKLNIIKNIITIDENMIYKYFPNREDNIYCKSIKNLIPYKDDNSIQLNKHFTLNESAKYYGINFTQLFNGRVEYRYLGGEDYHIKTNEIIYLLEYFIVTTYNSIDVALNTKDTLIFKTYLDEQKFKYNELSNLEHFKYKYPNISLEIDKNSLYHVVNAYYSNIYDDLYDIISNVKDFGEDCIINYDTETSNIEIVDGDLELLGSLADIIFINSRITEGELYYCEIIKSEVNNTIINNTNIEDSTVKDSKILSSKVYDDSELIDCYFCEGILDAVMKGGVFRSGTQGENAVISNDTQIFDDIRGNFFNIHNHGMQKIKK